MLARIPTSKSGAGTVHADIGIPKKIFFLESPRKNPLFTALHFEVHPFSLAESPVFLRPGDEEKAEDAVPLDVVHCTLRAELPDGAAQPDEGGTEPVTFPSDAAGTGSDSVVRSSAGEEVSQGRSQFGSFHVSSNTSRQQSGASKTFKYWSKP